MQHPLVRLDDSQEIWTLETPVIPPKPGRDTRSQSFAVAGDEAPRPLAPRRASSQNTKDGEVPTEPLAPWGSGVAVRLRRNSNLPPTSSASGTADEARRPPPAEAGRHVPEPAAPSQQSPQGAAGGTQRTRGSGGTPDGDEPPDDGGDGNGGPGDPAGPREFRRCPWCREWVHFAPGVTWAWHYTVCLSRPGVPAADSSAPTTSDLERTVASDVLLGSRRFTTDPADRFDLGHTLGSDTPSGQTTTELYNHSTLDPTLSPDAQPGARHPPRGFRRSLARGGGMTGGGVGTCGVQAL